MKKGEFLSTAEVEGFLSRVPPGLQDITLELRNMLARLCPQATERILWRGLSYHDSAKGGPIRGAICQIEPCDDHVRLSFVHGVRLEDPQALLEGDRKSKRYLRIASYENAPWEVISELIQAAAGLDPATFDAPLKPRQPGGYDPVVEEYAEKYFNELDHKPFDRLLLDRFAARVRGLGPVCDLGCGPGQIARYLHGRGMDAFGVDLSPGMVALARRLNPDLRFEQGDMRNLRAGDGAWGGIAAFYSIIHIPRQEVVGVLRELWRVLGPGGSLLLAFHIGDEVLHLDEWWGKPVSLDFTFFSLDEMEDYLRQAGFDILETLQRVPYEGVEHPSQRGYIWAEKP
jgi:SAM-dependent methyltransferase